MDKVQKNLWIGDINSAREQSMSEHGITKVITVCQDSVQDNVGCDYTHYNMSDGPDNKYGGDHTYGTYKKAADELYEALSDGVTTLIHCHKGQSRSVSVAVGAIGRFDGISSEQAFDKVENNRPQANPDALLLDHADKYIEETKN